MITFTPDEKRSELGQKIRDYLKQRINVLHKKLEKSGIPMDETEGLRRTIQETRLFLEKLDVRSHSNE